VVAVRVDATPLATPSVEIPCVATGEVRIVEDDGVGVVAIPGEAAPPCGPWVDVEGVAGRA